MGKKKDKLAAQQQQQQQQQAPWKNIDKEPLGFLVAPEDPDTFFKGNWEQKPAVFKATPERVALFQGLCSFPAVINWLKQREKKAGPLAFGVDVNAARYKKGVRETPNGEVADASALKALHDDEGCTLQLHQPQRFFDPCWRLLAAMERQLGCLVGSNAYLTPAGSQGLAPHHDDVELWVVQTHGSKQWKLYQPINAYQLPNQPSGDLDQGSLGQLVLEVELCVGDVLYMPRGTVHQAAAQTGDSSHLTISTYQRCSYADLATHLLQSSLLAQDEPECLPLAARRSPAPGTLLAHSLHRVLAPSTKGSTTPDAVAGLAEALRAIAAKLEASPDMLTPAVHASAMDFLMNRLPPHPKQLPPRGPAPTMDDKVWCRVAGWAYLLPFELTGMNCDDDDDDAGLEEGSVKMVSCLANSREEHMISAPDDESSEEGSSSEEEEEGPAGGSDEGGSDDDDEAAAGSGEGEEKGEAEDQAAAGKKKKQQQQQQQHGGEAHEQHHHHHHNEGEHHCCGDDVCGQQHGVQEHSLSSGADGDANPVAALPGLVLAPGVVKAVVAFMAAEGPEQAIAVRDLPLPAESSKMQLAFALWAEGLAATVPSAAQRQQQKEKHENASSKQKQHGDKKSKRPADAGAAAGEETATSTGKARPSKKAKA
ncbi:hypothetical protein OEZ86_011790 [Tetradesmus obliquus]|nr:hypothetical protein OEZ86_011790 [Tetradesmus obliquus]